MSYLVRNAKRAKAHTADTPRWKVDRDVERGPCLHSGARGSFSTLETLHAFCEVNGIECEYADEYGEPGYSTEKGILLCNWNDIPKSLQTRLEAQGYALEWSDEWYVDTDNSPCKAWRTTGDSMGWEPRIRAMDGYMITPDSDPQEWIDSSTNDESNTLPSWFDTAHLEAAHYRELDETHDPSNRLRSVFKEQRDAGRDVILQWDRSCDYRVWIKRREAARELFLSDARGVYIPRDFAQCVRREYVTGISDDDYAVLEAGPDHEHYWDTWSDVCDRAKVTAVPGSKLAGIVFRLEQDGDLWLIEDGAELDETDNTDDTYYII